MEFVKRQWAQIQMQLGEMPANTKWLFGALLVILMLALLLTLTYAGTPQYVPISQFAMERQGQVLERLRAAGIPVRQKNGRIEVPEKSQLDAIVMLERYNLMSADPSMAWDDLVKRRTVWLSNAQSEQDWLMAKMQVLEETIGAMEGVRSATVIVDPPKREGWGGNYVRPSASVSVVMDGRNGMNRQLADAISGLVSSAVAKMTPQDVTVIDAKMGKQWIANAEDEVTPEESLALLRETENYHQNKISSHLVHIPGVVVSVRVQIEPVKKWDEEAWVYEQDPSILSEHSKEMTRENLKQAGEPGARSNTMVDIQGSGTGGSREQTEERETSFSQRQPTKMTRISHTGRSTKRINATISVPQSYFVELFRQTFGVPQPEEGGASDVLQDQRFTGFVDQRLAAIKSIVEPLVETDEGVGLIRTAMIPDPSLMMQRINPTAAGNTMTAVLDSQWLKPAGLGLLVFLALSIMFTMVRRANQHPVMPSVEELAGVPPVLPSDDDLVGDVEESEAAMTGVEVNDDELRSRRIAEQISELVRTNPEEAAKLVKRWVGVEE